jgi:hypothetical protein
MRLTKRRAVFLLAGAVATGGLLILWGASGSGDGASIAPPVAKALAAAGEGEIAVGPLSDEQLAQTVQAIRELGGRSDGASGQTLRKLIRADQAVIRGEAAEALGRRDDADAALLAGVLNHDADAGARLGAAKGLAAIAAVRTLEQRQKVHDVVPQLVAGLSDAEPAVRAWSLRTLNDTCGKRFDFDASLPADQQVDKIIRIEQKLQRMGLLEEGSSPASPRPWGVRTSEEAPTQ